MVSPSDQDQQQTALCPPASAAALQSSARAIGRSLCSFGFQAIALLLGIALAFM